MRPACEDPLGCPAPALAGTFLPGLAVSHRTPSPAAFTTGSSSRELCVSSRVLRSTACLSSLELRRPCDRLPESEKRLPGGFLPLRDISLRRPLTARRIPAPSYGPSSTFRTSSTVYSATRLAGLFHPAATSRVFLQGFIPPSGAVRGFPRRCPRVGWTNPPATLRLRQRTRPRLQGLALHQECGDFSRRLVPPQLRAPLGFTPPPGFRSTHRSEDFAPPSSASFTAMNPPRLLPDALPVRGPAFLESGCRPARGFRPVASRSHERKTAPLRDLSIPRAHSAQPASSR